MPGGPRRLLLVPRGAARLGHRARRGLSAPGKKPAEPLSLVFCATNTAARTAAAAHPSATWIGVDSGEVNARLQRWKSKRVRVLFANRMLIEGADFPELAQVWIDKETESDILAVQMGGRVLRARPGKVGRIYCRSSAAAAHVRQALERLNHFT